MTLGLITSQSTPLSSDLTTLVSAFAELNLVSDDDIHIERLIKRASGVITAYCGRTFGVQTITETFRYPARAGFASVFNVGTFGTPLYSTFSPIILTGIPVISITSVVEVGTTLDPTTDYEYETSTGILWRLYNGYRNPWLLHQVTVTYVAGYVLPNDAGTRTLPQEIEEVCLSLVRGAWFARGGDPQIVRQMVEGVGYDMWAINSPMSGMEIDANSQMILAPYRRRV